MPMTITAARLVITGRVQGVGFRAWTRREARRRGLRGWVRNSSDGNVEALVIGEAAVLDSLAEACRRGPAMARVAGVARFPAEDDGSRDFEERPTL
jgi:acylphosphatase